MGVKSWCEAAVGPEGSGLWGKGPAFPPPYVAWFHSSGFAFQPRPAAFPRDPPSTRRSPGSLIARPCGARTRNIEPLRVPGMPIEAGAKG